MSNSAKLMVMIKEAMIKVAAMPGSATIEQMLRALTKRRAAAGGKFTASAKNLLQRAKDHIAAGGGLKDILPEVPLPRKTPAPAPVASFLPKGITKKPPVVPTRGTPAEVNPGAMGASIRKSQQTSGIQPVK